MSFEFMMIYRVYKHITQLKQKGTSIILELPTDFTTCGFCMYTNNFEVIRETAKKNQITK